jgi:hypothetical protein
MRDSLSPNDVQLSQYHTVTSTNFGHQWIIDRDGFPVERSVGHLRTNLTLQTDQIEKRLIYVKSRNPRLAGLREKQPSMHDDLVQIHVRDERKLRRR